VWSSSWHSYSTIRHERGHSVERASIRFVGIFVGIGEILVYTGPAFVGILARSSSPLLGTIRQKPRKPLGLRGFCFGWCGCPPQAAPLHEDRATGKPLGPRRSARRGSRDGNRRSGLGYARSAACPGAGGGAIAAPAQ